jgi:biopolymer transport protein ExbD
MAGGAADNNEEEISGINVTPLVDIMLVLLIIFMVTATFIANKAIELKLPEADSAQTQKPDEKTRASCGWTTTPLSMTRLVPESARNGKRNLG